MFAGEQRGYIYTRIGNPTTAAFEERMASLEGGIGALATASGQAAQLIAILALCRQGDEVVASRSLYGGTYTQFDVTLRRMGIDVTFVDVAEPGAFASAVEPGRTMLVIAESPSNPRLELADLDELGGALRRVADGGSVVDPKVVEALIGVESNHDSVALDRLTERERDVLAEMATGKSNSSIGEALFISARSVEKHINSIFSKLHLSDESESNRRVRSVLLWLAEYT